MKKRAPDEDFWKRVGGDSIGRYSRRRTSREPVPLMSGTTTMRSLTSARVGMIPTVAAEAVGLPRNLAAERLVGAGSSFHRMFVGIGVAVGKQPWLWATADAVALTLILLNVLVLVALHARRLRQYFRSRRAKHFHGRVEELLADLDPATGG